MTTYIKRMVIGAETTRLTQAEADSWVSEHSTLPTLHRGPRLSADGNQVLSATGEVLAERAPSLPSRREALDALARYALRELDLHPELLTPGLDVGMREAQRRARQALPLFAAAERGA